MLCSILPNSRAAIDETVGLTDDVRERTFGNLNFVELLKTGSLVCKEHQIENIIYERWGDEKSLLNPSGPPVMVLCSLKHDGVIDQTTRKTGDYDYEPFIFRTYEYPHDSTTATDDDSSMFNSSSSIEMHKAIAATTALPVVVDRIHTQIDGKDVSLADGGIFGDCPIAVAIDEARRLYPRRPLGVILSIGMNEHLEKKMIEQVVKTAKIIHPKMYFQRIAPHDICANFPTLEKDLEKVAIMEEQVREYVRRDKKVVAELDETMRMLTNQKRTKPKYITENGSLEQSRHDMLLSSANYQERTQFRTSISESTHALTHSTLSLFLKESSRIIMHDVDDSLHTESMSSNDAIDLVPNEYDDDDLVDVKIGDKEIVTDPESKIQNDSGGSYGWNVFTRCLSCLRKNDYNQ